MSIATLKKQSQVKYFDKVSSNKTFSLNGTRRNVGYVGQNNLMRSLKRTPYTRNGLPQTSSVYGNHLQGIHNSGSCSNNDPNVIKPSVKNTKGMISSRFKFYKRPYPYSVVQPDDNSYLVSEQNQSDYIEKLKSINDCVPKNAEPLTCVNKCTKFVGSKKKVSTTIVKDDKVIGTYDLYNRKNLINKCASITIWPPRVNNTRKPHFGCGQRTNI